MVATAIACLVTASSRTTSLCATSPRTRTLRCRFFYRVTALWGAHGVSLLLWIFLWLAGRSGGRRRCTPAARFGARVLGVLGVVRFGFLLFTLARLQISFLVLIPAAARNGDLNPILTGSGARDSPADPLHGLCQVRGRFYRICLRGDARRAAR